MSRYGTSRGVSDYDCFRTGLTYRDVRRMLEGKKYRRRGSVLGAWHQIKLEMFEQATGIWLG